MARDENAVMYAVEQVCNLYGVQVTREQSRQFNVQGAAGRWRPMFFGTWTDAEGIETHWTSGKQRKTTNIWHAGKPDFLARPRILARTMSQQMAAEEKRAECTRINSNLSPIDIWRVMSVPLWIECKALKTKNQKSTVEAQAAFQRWVERNGDFYLRLREDVRPLIAWFDAHGVTKQCDDVALAQVVTPMDAAQLYLLPCKWCGLPRDPEHKPPVFACPLHLAQCNTKLIGKVWSPNLRRNAPRAQASAGSDEL